MDQKDFTDQLKDLLPHLHDYTAIETHALVTGITPAPGFQGTRGEYLRKLVFEGIEQMKPAAGAPVQGALEWRAYLILHNRYVEGANLADLSAGLALSDRQVRRDHNRAVEGLAARLFDRIFRLPLAEAAAVSEGDQGYQLNPESLDLNRLVDELAPMLMRLAERDEAELHVCLPKPGVRLLGDRIVVRQVLIALFNYSMHLRAGRSIELRVEEGALAGVALEFQVDSEWNYWSRMRRKELLGPVEFWAQRMGASLEENYPAAGKEGTAVLRLVMQPPQAGTILLIDDQEPALRMFKRYLSRTVYEVMGISDPAEALKVARQVRPALITLDVMMPHVDGWEILQALKADPATRNIPVIVCSAWDEPELAKSLGAAAFLKKPVVQKDLLEAIEALRLPSGSAAGTAPRAI